MTTIIVTEKAIAYDLQYTKGIIKYKNCKRPKVKKVIDFDGNECFIGGAGSVESLTDFEHWITEKDHEFTCNKSDEYSNNMEAFAYYPNTQELFVYYNSLIPMVESLPFVTGSGSEFALGALHATGDIYKAMAAAGALDTNTSEDFHVIKFKFPRKKKAVASND